MFRIRSDTRGIDKLEASLKRLPLAVRRAVISAGSKALAKRVREGFWQSRDPSGKKWAPLKRRKGRPLWLTRAMMKSFRPLMAGMGFGVTTSDKKFEFHQGGTRNADGSERIPARRMLPKPGTMPKRWERDLNKAAEKAVAEVMKKVMR